MDGLPIIKLYSRSTNNAAIILAQQITDISFLGEEIFIDLSNEIQYKISINIMDRTSIFDELSKFLVYPTGEMKNFELECIDFNKMIIYKNRV